MHPSSMSARKSQAAALDAGATAAVGSEWNIWQSWPGSAVAPGAAASAAHKPTPLRAMALPFEPAKAEQFGSPRSFSCDAGSLAQSDPTPSALPDWHWHGRDSAGDLTPPETTCYAKDGYDLPTLEEVVDEVHASIQEMMKSLKRKRHSRPLEARGAMWLLEKVNRVIHQGQEKIKEVEQHNIMQKYFRQQFAEIEQNQKLLSQQLEKLLEKHLKLEEQQNVFTSS